IRLISGRNYKKSQGHGTAVLGVIRMVDNTLGGIGIVPNVPSTMAVSEWQNPRFSTWAAIIAATKALQAGDVLLLETQTVANLPVEVQDAYQALQNQLVFGAIQTATTLGIVVIEAAGNGGQDLDSI